MAAVPTVPRCTTLQPRDFIWEMNKNRFRMLKRTYQPMDSIRVLL